jgi:hypothetical protein
VSGAPASTPQAGRSHRSRLKTLRAPITALVDAPAVIANGFLNGQATFPDALNLSNLTAPVGVLDGVVNISVVENLPLDGILDPPGYRAATVTVTSALIPFFLRSSLTSASEAHPSVASRPSG